MEPAASMARVMCTASTPWEWPSTASRLGLGHAVAEVFEVEQGAELGQRHAFHGRGGVGCGAEACRVRGEAEQVDRTAGGGQQVGGDRGEQSAGCGDVAAQGLVKAGIGGLVCQGYRATGWTGRRRRAHGARWLGD